MNKISHFFSNVNFEYVKKNIFENAHLACVTKRVSCIAKCIFKCFAKIITFPLRYLGSKTWSLPGMIVRFPIILFNRIIKGNNKTPLKQALFQSGYNYHSERRLTKDELLSHLPSIGAMAYVNKCEHKFIEPFKFQNMTPAAMIKSGLKSPSWMKSENNFFIDESTGLKVSILENEDQIVVTFGPAGSYTLSPEMQKKRVFSLRNYQYFTAHLNLIGLKPKIYSRANQFFKLLEPQLKKHNKPIILTGSCFGGTLASYVALKNQVPAVCMNTLQLGGGLQQSIGQRRLNEAEKYVTHIKVEGDYLSGSKYRGMFDKVIGFLGIRTPGNFGKKYSIKTYHKERNKIHSWYMDSVVYHLGYPQGTKFNDCFWSLKASLS